MSAPKTQRSSPRLSCSTQTRDHQGISTIIQPQTVWLALESHQCVKSAYIRNHSARRKGKTAFAYISLNPGVDTWLSSRHKNRPPRLNTLPFTSFLHVRNKNMKIYAHWQVELYRRLTPFFPSSLCEVWEKSLPVRFFQSTINMCYIANAKGDGVAIHAVVFQTQCFCISFHPN